jgi:hypothetical protein
MITVTLVLGLKLPPVVGQSQGAPHIGSATKQLDANPAPPCFDNSNRYVDCGNGTVTDTATGLIWVQDAACFGALDWAAANQAAAVLADGQCGLTDGSKPGDWRLPTNAEWMATTEVAVALDCTQPALTTDDGTRCYGDGSTSSFLDVAVSGGYWSSTTYASPFGIPPDATKAGTMALGDGVLLSFFDKACCPQLVWPVRVR